MLSYIKIKERNVPNMKGGRGMLNRSKKAGYLAMGKYWHAIIRPQHFTAAARARYQYDPRKGDPSRPDPYGFRKSYQGQKLKKHGHTRPLEKSGESQAQTRAATVTGSSRHVRIRMAAGWFGYARRNHDIDLADELTRIDHRDADRLGRVFLRTLDHALDREVQQATTTV